MIRTAPLLIALCLVIGAPDRSVRAQGALDYTQWRGNARDGAASGFVEPASWPQALKRQWKVDVGEGYGTPVVVGDMVYVFTRRDGEEVLTALDAAAGKERWRSGYAAPYSPSQPTVVHGAGPKATPLFHEGKLFTLGISGILSAFDAKTGKRLWQTAAPAEVPFFSAASSPVGAKGVVIAHPGNYEPLTAFDVNTGAVKWRAGAGGFFMSPLIVTLGGVAQVVSVTQEDVIGVSLDSGAVLWKQTWAGGGMGGTMPIAYGDTIIVGAGNGLMAFRPSQKNGTWVTETLWQTSDVTFYLSNPVVVGDTLFGLSQRSRGQYFAVDARTGKVLWLGPPRQATNTAVVKAGELLFLLNDTAELIVARASQDTFVPLKSYTVAESATWAQPTLSGKRIFVKDVNRLTLWTVE